VPGDFVDKVARIALALERAGGDHFGGTASLHRDFQDLIDRIPLRDRYRPFTRVPREGAAEGGHDEEAEEGEEDLRL
jgi:hypothetical protein